MKKLVKGIIEFHNKLQPEYRDTFARLALGQKPDALFVTCSDSRVAVNVFASTDPGDLFVIRNVGNMIPPCGKDGKSVGDESEAAAVEFALNNLNISHIVICGHAECGAMHAIKNGREKIPGVHLKSWLRHAEDVKLKVGDGDVNVMSRANVLLQMEHVKSYPEVKRRFDEGKLQIHGLWFDIPNADVYYFDPEKKDFVILDDEAGQRILPRLKEP